MIDGAYIIPIILDRFFGVDGGLSSVSIDFGFPHDIGPHYYVDVAVSPWKEISYTNEELGGRSVLSHFRFLILTFCAAALNVPEWDIQLTMHLPTIDQRYL